MVEPLSFHCDDVSSPSGAMQGRKESDLATEAMIHLALLTLLTFFIKTLECHTSTDSTHLTTPTQRASAWNEE